jgi:hypothetical protein
MPPHFHRLFTCIHQRRYIAMPRVPVLLPCLCAAIIVAGCSKNVSPIEPSSPATSSGQPGTSTLPDKLRGYWLVVSVKVDGIEAPFAEALNRNRSTEAEILGLVGNDAFYLMDYDASAAAVHTESGITTATSQQLVLTTLKVNGQTLTPYNTMLSQWKVDGDTLTLTTEIGGKAVVVIYRQYDFYNSPYF